MARSLHTGLWVLLLAGAALVACSKDRAVAGAGRSTAAFAPNQASSAVGKNPRATAGEEPNDASAPSGAVPKGYVSVAVAGVAPTPAGAAVLLLHGASRRVVPVFVGGTEAMSIELRLEHRRYTRPLTHDLLDSVLGKVGATIKNVRVEKLEEGTYHATIVMEFEGRDHEFDARSSDAVALALGHGAPIQMAETILAQTGVSLDSLEQSGALDGGLVGDASSRNAAGDITL